MPAASQRFRPEQHLLLQGDIRAVREQGRRVDCRAFTIWWRRRDAEVAAATTGTSPEPAINADAPAAKAGSASPRTPARKGPAVTASSPARVCVIASTAAVGWATRRNLAKRRLREVFRHQQHLVPAGCDLLLIARAAATTVPLPELEKKFGEACRQIPAGRLASGASS